MKIASDGWRRDAPALVGAVIVAAAVWMLGRAFVTVAILHRAPSAFFASAIWGLLVLASFAGWGTALNAALFRPDRADWGLRCAWGWAIAVAVGGVLCAVHLAFRPALVALVAVGLMSLMADLVLGYRRWSRRRRWRVACRNGGNVAFASGAASVFALASVSYLAAIVNGNFNGNDDLLCYFGFAREILDRGTLSQPFSFRRIHVYGGTSLLDALQIAIPVPDVHLHLVDQGMALLTVMALVVGHLRVSPRASRALVLLLLLLTVTLPEVRMNTSATMIGAAMFLGLHRTMAWPAAGRHGARGAVPVALLSAAACTLRQNYLAPVGVLLALEFGIPILRGVRVAPALRIAGAPVRRAAFAAALLVLCLVPWWAMSLRWCRSFLFPVVPGNYNKDYDYFHPLSTFDELRYIWDNVMFCYPVKAVPLFLLAALTAVDRHRHRRVVYFAIASFLGFALLIHAYPDIDAPNLGRYYFGFTFPALLAIGLAVADDAGRPPGRARARADRAVAPALVVMAMGAQLYSDHDQTHKQWTQYLAMIAPEFERPAPWQPPGRDPEYTRIQDAIPPGAPVAVMVDQFDQFDLRRNPVESLDMVGAISPPPGLPLFGTPDQVADYLIGQGYRYLVVVHPDAAAWLYRRDVWLHPENALEVYRRTARFYLRAFDVFDALRASRRHVADTPRMTAIDLSLRTN